MCLEMSISPGLIFGILRSLFYHALFIDQHHLQTKYYYQSELCVNSLAILSNFMKLYSTILILYIIRPVPVTDKYYSLNVTLSFVLKRTVYFLSQAHSQRRNFPSIYRYIYMYI